jgi:hypothetical protein
MNIPFEIIGPLLLLFSLSSLLLAVTVFISLQAYYSHREWKDRRDLWKKDSTP